MNRRPLIHDYAVARTAVTHDLTKGVQKLAKLMDAWKTALHPQESPHDKKTGGRFAAHVDHFRWLLEKNFAAEGFSGKDHPGPIQSVAYLESLYGKARELAKAHAEQIAPDRTPDTALRRKLTDKIVRTHIDLAYDYTNFSEGAAIEIGWEKAGEEQKRSAQAPKERSDLAIQTTRDDMKFLTDHRIISALPQP